MGFLRKLFKPEEKKVITVVSGLPRSGTSMMMKMLEAGGIPPLTDEIRAADADNPRGYYEFERVKKLDKGDTAWLPEAQGKVVKVISALLKHLPDGYTYRVIFMRRHLDEVLASQKQMLIRRGEPTDKVSDEELKRLFQKHLQHIERWVGSRPNVSLVDINYNDLLQDPAEQVKKVIRFLGSGLDEAKMMAVIDRNLYRQRR